MFLDDWEGTSVFWNPSISELKDLPPTSLKPHPDTDDSYFLCGGFGFDSASEDYKAVRFFYHCFLDVEYDPDRVAYEVEVYSLKSDSWKKIPYDYQVCPSLIIHLLT